MNAFDVMSVDVVAAKDNANVIGVITRLVLGVFNAMPIIDDNGSDRNNNCNWYLVSNKS